MMRRLEGGQGQLFLDPEGDPSLGVQLLLYGSLSVLSVQNG
jgi:hypothetical protein